MAMAYILEFPGGTAAQYDAVMAEMQLGGQPSPGGVLHVAGPTDGGWCVVDVWESPAAFDKFRAEYIEPLTRKHGIGAPRVTAFPVHNILR
jgi:hypothetical protein